MSSLTDPHEHYCLGLTIDNPNARFLQNIDDNCPICRLPWAKGDKVVQHLCLKIFHYECLKQWVESGPATRMGVNDCPNCRGKVLDVQMRTQPGHTHEVDRTSNKMPTHELLLDHRHQVRPFDSGTSVTAVDDYFRQGKRVRPQGYLDQVHWWTRNDARRATAFNDEYLSVGTRHSWDIETSRRPRIDYFQGIQTIHAGAMEVEVEDHETLHFVFPPQQWHRVLSRLLRHHWDPYSGLRVRRVNHALLRGRSFDDIVAYALQRGIEEITAVDFRLIYPESEELHRAIKPVQVYCYVSSDTSSSPCIELVPFTEEWHTFQKVPSTRGILPHDDGASAMLESIFGREVSGYSIVPMGHARRFEARPSFQAWLKIFRQDALVEYFPSAAHEHL